MVGYPQRNNLPGEGGTGGTRARRLLFSLWNVEKKTPVDGKAINRKRLQVLFFLMELFSTN